MEMKFYFVLCLNESVFAMPKNAMYASGDSINPAGQACTCVCNSLCVHNYPDASPKLLKLASWAAKRGKYLGSGSSEQSRGCTSMARSRHH